MTMPKPGTSDWDDLVRGVLFANPADKKAWTAVLAEAGSGNSPSRARVVQQIIAYGRRHR